MNSARIIVFTFAASRPVSYAKWVAYLLERWQSGRMYLTLGSNPTLSARPLAFMQVLRRINRYSTLLSTNRWALPRLYPINNGMDAPTLRLTASNVP